MNLEKINPYRDLKEMLEKTGEIYGDRPAFKYKENDEIKYITHKEFRDDINALGTAMIEMGLKNKRIAVISENRYEWEVAYLAITCGVGVVVPLDKALPDNEIESLILRSEAEAIFYSNKYEECMNTIQKQGNTKLKYFISMDLEKNDFNKYSQKELTDKGREFIGKGNKEYLDSKINNEEMTVMLFTSGTTSTSKAVMLSHKNLCTNIADIISSFYVVTEKDTLLSFLPLHHTFECTVGFLFPITRGASIVFSKGVRHISDELKEFKISAMICVPVVYEKMYHTMMKKIEKNGKLEKVKKGVKVSNVLRKIGIDKRKKLFGEIHENLGGNINVLVAGGAPLDPEVEKGFNDLGFNLEQGYGLTETSPVIAAEIPSQRRLGSIGKKFPSVEVKLADVDEKGIGELIVKADSVMLGYYNNDEANSEAFDEEGWFHTGDLAKIDKDGYIYITGRKKFVIVLKNGKNVYPEELETLVNKLDEVKECMVYGKPENDGDVAISVKIVYDEEVVKDQYGDITEEELRNLIWPKIKEINKTMPKYKYIRNMILTTEELVKTTTLKTKRNIEMEKILKVQK